MAKQLFDDLQATELKADVWTYTSLINACQTCGNQWRQGLAFFQEMEAKGEHTVSFASTLVTQALPSQVHLIVHL